MGHIAAGDGRVSLPRTGNRDHRGILEIVIVAAVPEAAPVGLGRLEGGAVEGAEFPVLVGHLGAFHLDGQPFADPARDIVEQFGVLVDVVDDHVVQVVRGLVLHAVQILVAADGFDGGKGADLSAPDAKDSGEQGNQDAGEPD